MADLIEKIINGVNYKVRKGSFSDPDATPEYTVKRASKAKGKNPNIYKHIIKDANGNTYEVRSKFPGKADLGEVMSRKFMDRSATIKDAASRVDGKGVSKPDERAKVTKSLNKEMSGKHFNETSAEPTSNSAVKNSVWNKLKNTKAGNWLKNTKVGGYFTDSPLTPMNVALTHKPHMGGTPILRSIAANPVAYAANAYGMGSGGGYMPVGENTVDQLRIEHHPEDLSSFGTAVPINDKGTLYINPDTGATPTDIKIGSNGEEYYRVSPDKSLYKPVYGSGEAIEEDALNSLKDTHISADQLARNNIAKAKIANFNKTADYLNDIILGVIKNIPQDISKLPLPPMSADTDEGEIPSGTVVVGPDTEVKSVSKPTVASVVKSKKIIKPTVVNNTPVVKPATPVSTPTPAVAAPTLSSVTSQAIRPNGGFDNYRRQSVLSALRAAGGISPAEAVQRGIIPWEALNYV